ncbi:MAG: recombinase family protein [Aestuariivita sp.]|nr:recombinase family protein [Aestuariivita sp.]MCY4345374.1 recombinase family protein [Aestuariivita sp.]
MTRTGDILGYARVSTVDQDLSGQRDRLLEYGAVRVFEDVISGKTFARPGLSDLLKQSRPNDTLAVIRLDRLGRSLKELLETVDSLKARDINLISLEEQIDTTSAAGELVFHVFGAIAHFERRLIAERTKDGLANARKHGRLPGRPSLPLETISALRDLVDAGKSVPQAAKHLGIGRSTAYKALQSAAPRSR